MASFQELQQRWEDFQLNKTQVFWVCGIAVAATLIGGFGIAGWVTAGRAEAMSAQAAQDARRELAVAVCVEDFTHERDAAARLAKLKSAEFYRRGDVIATGGFATMPDRKEADDAVAAQCAAALEDVKLPAGAKK
jgi:hypothetical protein